jgi:hypothetical protein
VELFGEKYAIFQKTPEHLITKNLEKRQYLIGARQNGGPIYLLAVIGRTGNSMVALIDLARVAGRINRETRGDNISEVFVISSEMQIIAHDNLPRKEREKMLAERKE